MSEAGIREAFGRQADWCDAVDAPFVARLCRSLAKVLDPATPLGARVLGWAGDPFGDALMMRVTGGLNALVRSGELPDLASRYPPHVTGPDFDAVLSAALRDDRLLPWLDGPPQTNEVGRSGVLMPGLLAIAAATRLPLALCELGASGGLNLRLGTYGYTLGGHRYGPENATVHLAPKWHGAPPPDATVEVVARRGVDVAPVDVTDPAAQARLLAYVWPDQPARVARLEAALVAAAADPAPVDRADAADWVERHVAPVEGRTVVVFHSIAFQYFPPGTQARIAAHMVAQGALATAAAPLAWLRYEIAVDDPGAPPTLRLRLWPGGEDRLLAEAHPHGASIQWLG